MTNQERRKLQSLIRKHVEAQVALSWSGSAEPSDRDIIAANAEAAKRKLYNHLSMMAES